MKFLIVLSPSIIFVFGFKLVLWKEVIINMSKFVKVAGVVSVLAFALVATPVHAFGGWWGGSSSSTSNEVNVRVRNNARVRNTNVSVSNTGGNSQNFNDDGNGIGTGGATSTATSTNVVNTNVILIGQSNN
jgi:hypothetical protein